MVPCWTGQAIEPAHVRRVWLIVPVLTAGSGLVVRTTNTHGACSPVVHIRLHSLHTHTHTLIHAHTRTHKQNTDTFIAFHLSIMPPLCLTCLKTTPFPLIPQLIPPASAISTVRIFSLSGITLPVSGLSASQVSTSTAGPLVHTSISGPAQAMLLSSALPPIAAKVVKKKKIKSGPMQDLLVDNMSLCSQLEA